MKKSFVFIVFLLAFSTVSVGWVIKDTENPVEIYTGGNTAPNIKANINGDTVFNGDGSATMTYRKLYGSLKIDSPENSTPLVEINGIGTAKRISLLTSATEVFGVNSSGQTSITSPSTDGAVLLKSNTGNAYYEADAATGSTPQFRFQINNVSAGLLRATTTNSLEVFNSASSSQILTLNGSSGLATFSGGATFTGGVSGPSSTALVAPNGVLAGGGGAGQWRSFTSTSTADDGSETWTIPASNWVELSLGTNDVDENFFGFARGGSWSKTVYAGAKIDTIQTLDPGLGGITDGTIGICFVNNTTIKVYNRMGSVRSFTAHVRFR